MTYCMAWLWGDEVAVIADSAVSRDASPEVRPRVDRSSFDELHEASAGRLAEQGAMKIQVVENGAFCFAGDVRSGNEFRAVLSAMLKSGLRPAPAFRNAVTSISPLQPSIDLECFWAHWDGGPRILYSDFRRHPYEYRSVVQAGSLSNELKGLAASLGDQVHWSMPSETIVARMVGAVQSFGVHRRLMAEQGVGGHTVGCRVGRDGIHWQPDTLFLVYSSNSDSLSSVGVWTVIRDGAAAVISGFTNDVRVFAPANMALDSDAWRDKWGSELRRIPFEGMPGWVVFLDRYLWRFVVVEVPGSDTRIRIVASVDGVKVSVSAELRNELFSPAPDNVFFIPTWVNGNTGHSNERRGIVWRRQRDAFANSDHDRVLATGWAFRDMLTSASSRSPYELCELARMDFQGALAFQALGSPRQAIGRLETLLRQPDYNLPQIRQIQVAARRELRAIVEAISPPASAEHK